MTAADLESLAERLMHGEFTTADLHAAARCAREAVLLSRVAVRSSMLLARLKEQKPQPPQSMMVKIARKQLQTALEAVEAAEVKP